MQVYLVGGAVRDELLGLKPQERDWVVVGATPEQLVHAGYRAVGREFPVFLHPETHEEYALARLERKVAPGYRGFVTEFSPAVTLEEDLRRRDLTINAMARAPDGRLIDPYGGRADLDARRLRHVSPAFAEDPVRILRVARFAARYAGLGFTIAPETLALMRRMVAEGEAGALVSERVWRELERALCEAAPQRAFEVLRDCGALGVVLPELQARPDLEHALAALRAAAEAQSGAAVRWAALLARLPGQEIEALCQRLRVPGDYRELALLSARLRARLCAGARLPATDPHGLLELFEAVDAFRRPQRFAAWLEVLVADAHGRDPHAAQASVDAARALAAQLTGAFAAAAAVRLKPPELQSARGPERAALLRQQRLRALSAASGNPV
jgi:tRNA nucleotidyltransferase (CCA-adding enzyme)